MSNSCFMTMLKIKPCNKRYFPSLLLSHLPLPATISLRAVHGDKQTSDCRNNNFYMLEIWIIGLWQWWHNWQCWCWLSRFLPWQWEWWYGYCCMAKVRVLRFHLEKVLIVLAAKTSNFFNKIFVVGPEHQYVPHQFITKSSIWSASKFMIIEGDDLTSYWQSLQ